MDFKDQFARVDRAVLLGEGLASSMQSWAGSDSMSVEANIAPDRLSWELVLRVHKEPPLREWSFQFGESAHHLRSALDNLAVAIAEQSGVTRQTILKNIYFPICRSEADWKNSEGKIAALPQQYRRAIEQLQPFQRPNLGQSVDDDPLPILSSLDNHDKHRLQVKTTIPPHSMNHTPTVSFETEEGAAASVPPDTEFFAPSLTDGGLLLRHRTKGRIAKVQGEYDVQALVCVSLSDGREFGATHILANLCAYIRSVLSYIAAVE